MDSNWPARLIINHNGYRPSLVKIDHKPPLKVKNNSFAILSKNFKFGRAKPRDLSSDTQLFKKFTRMKTIYGHANPGEQAMSVSCLEFDLTNKYIITGADDK